MAEKQALVQELLEAKARAGVTYDEIAAQTSLTNAYVAQLFHRQVRAEPPKVSWRPPLLF